MKLGIGTAQFGLDYGISNQEGKTPPAEVANILDVANHHGIRVIDTAPLYGTSEQILGKMLTKLHHFDVVTKTPQFFKSSLTDEDADVLEKTFHQSLLNLGRSSIYALLVHRADDLLAENGERIMERMFTLKQQGKVKKIGVSVYHSQQIEKILNKYSLDLIQLPINILDQRLLFEGYLQKLKEKNVEIHVRSVFLQGLLLMPPSRLSSFFDKIKNHLIRYHNFITHHQLSPVQAALGFVMGLNEVDVVIFGVNNSIQLAEIMTEAKPLSIEQFKGFSLSDESILNPSQWQL